MRATTHPALQPGARPPGGGEIVSAAIPAAASSQAVTELEFHISPAPSSSRPQTGVGRWGTRSSTRRARSRSRLIGCGLATASATSGITPPRHRQTS
ncbi:MAG TPA: hypothetical protein VII87_03525 [Solirubrobacteraceae bacterium]